MLYRDQFVECPSCAATLADVRVGASSFQRCRSCGGVFLRDETLAAMWTDMAPGSAPPSLVPRRTDRSPRPCPVCRAAMTPVALLGIPLDRCADDGVWFDDEELPTALAGASIPPEEWIELFKNKLAQMR